MNDGSIGEQLAQLHSYIGWSSQDAARLVSAGKLLEPSFPALIEDFYSEIDKHAATRAVITGGATQIERLKLTLQAWLRELFSGCYDSAYASRRWRVGWRHVEIGLPQVYTHLALSRLRQGLIRTLYNCWKGTNEEFTETVLTINRALDLDLAIIDDAYQSESMSRHARTERLATLGHIAAGIAHELRNPLNVIGTSIYFLTNAQKATPDKIQTHYSRIRRQVELSNEVITALSDFAKLPLEQSVTFEIGPLVKQILADGPAPPLVAITVNFPAGMPSVRGDRRQIGIVFRNLIKNAQEAINGQGQLSIDVRRTDSAVAIAVRDTGCGIPKEKLSQIAEPLVTTKERGLGLGLSMVAAILENHGTTLTVVSAPGEGTTVGFELALADNKAAPLAVTNEEEKDDY